MIRSRTRALYTALFALFLAPVALAQHMTLRVDAHDIPRHLVHATLEIPVEAMEVSGAGEAEVFYVEWVPGNHNPSGPVWNIVNFKASDDQGRTVEWRRDSAHTTRHILTVPEDAEAISLEYTYIASQPWVNSRSTDTYGRRNYGGLNWNSVLFYPGNADKDDLMIDASLRLPRGWTLATSLDPREGDRAAMPTPDSEGDVAFARVSLAELVDSPVIFGEHLATYDLGVHSGAPHFFHAVSPSADLLPQPGDEGYDERWGRRLERFRHMIEEAIAIFGPFPYDEYHFLILLGDDLPGFGLEHTQSTYIRMSESALVKAETTDYAMTVVPHEYIHVWCGKLRAPRGLHTRAYHEPGVTNLMWVYEGLTSYYDEILSARTGLYTHDEFIDSLVRTIERYTLQEGRTWRSVEDTAAALRHLRAPSARWEGLRRRQDYYAEGSLFWMEVDAMIRAGSGNGKTLDDFCRSFFAVKPGAVGAPVEHTREDVVQALTELHPGIDWDAFIRQRIETPIRSIASVPLADKLGYLWAYDEQPATRTQRERAEAESADLRNSLGFQANKEGEITSILLASPAFSAGLGHDMRIVGVRSAGSQEEHEEYSAQALRDAVARTPRTGGVDLLVEWAGETMQVEVSYSDGLRYPRLIRDLARVDTLSEIVKPLTREAEESSQ